MASDPVTFIIYLLIASILLWLCLYLASSWRISKEYASNKKLMLLISAIILVLLVPLISGAIGSLLGDVGTIIRRSSKSCCQRRILSDRCIHNHYCIPTLYVNTQILMWNGTMG